MATRLDRNYPKLYFGAPGKLITLPYPRGGIARPYNRQTFEFATGAGNYQVSTLASGARSYTLAWEALHVDTFVKLEQYRIGANGPGPFVLIDPSATNLLPPNVAAAGGIYSNTTDWIAGATGNGTILVNSLSTHVHRMNGFRSIRWYMNPAVLNAFPVIEVAPMYRSWPGMPVVPGLPYSFSAWMKPDGVVDTNITCAMKLEWKDITNTPIGAQESSGDIAITTWQRLSVGANAPSSAAYVRPFWVATASTILADSSLYLDEIMMEQDNVVNDWAPGTGVRPVEIVSLTENVSNFASRFRTGVQMEVRELSK